MTFFKGFFEAFCKNKLLSYKNYFTGSRTTCILGTAALRNIQFYEQFLSHVMSSGNVGWAAFRGCFQTLSCYLRQPYKVHKEKAIIINPRGKLQRHFVWLKMKYIAII